MSYVDGFVLPIKSENIEAYTKMASNARSIWLEHGALEYKECVLEDATKSEYSTPFPQAFAVKEGETVVFAFIVYKSREHRDEVNAKVMADKRMMEGVDPDNMPFDCQRMAYSGFRTIVE